MRFDLGVGGDLRMRGENTGGRDLFVKPADGAGPGLPNSRMKSN